MTLSPGRLIVQRFQQARARTRETEERELTPKEFLDLVDPKGKRSEKSARDYLRRLEKGERKGTLIKRRADADSGRSVNVRYKVGEYTDATGQRFEDIRSANVVIPLGKSRLDMWQGDRLRKAVNRYLGKSYSRRAGTPHDKDYHPMRRLPSGATLVEITRISGSRYPSEVLR